MVCAECMSYNHAFTSILHRINGIKQDEDEVAQVVVKGNLLLCQDIEFNFVLHVRTLGNWSCVAQQSSQNQ